VEYAPSVGDVVEAWENRVSLTGIGHCDTCARDKTPGINAHVAVAAST
jgi:hypothetical protein